MDEGGSSESTPSAAITYEGSRVEEVHADPEERADSLLSPISTDSPSTYAKEMFRLWGSRLEGCPFTNASSTLERIRFWRWSRRAARRLLSSPITSRQISAALPKPTTNGPWALRD